MLRAARIRRIYRPRYRRNYHPVRRFFGFVCLGIGLLGALMPIIPGWLFLIPGIALIGRHDPLLRQIAIAIRMSLRVMRHTRTSWIRNTGFWLTKSYVKTRHALYPHVHRLEKMFG